MSSRCTAVAPGPLRSRSAAFNIRGDVQGKDSVVRPGQYVVLNVLLGSKPQKTDTSSLFLLNSFIIRRGALPRGGKPPREEATHACGTLPQGLWSRHLQSSVRDIPCRPPVQIEF